MSGLSPCTREQFDAFIESYPRALTRNICGMVEPPQAQYYDFTLGAGGAALVAAKSLPYDSSAPDAAESGWRIKA